VERVKIKSLLRKESGKEASKKIRREGFIPAVIYGRGFNVPVKLSRFSLTALRAIHFSESTVIDMVIEGYRDNSSKINVLIKDIQYNPLTEEVIHIDFVKVSLEEKIRVNIPVVLKGDCKGVKDGGILEQMLWEVEVEALPLEIPEKIELNVSSLEIGDSLHVKDISFDKNIKVIEDASETIVTVVAKQEEVEVEEKSPEEEPEVIKEKEKEKEAKIEKEEG